MSDQVKSRRSRGANPDAKSSTYENISRTIEQLVAAGKLLLVAALFIFVVMNWSFFSNWLLTVQHVEWLGWKLDRYQAEQNIQGLRNSQSGVPRYFSEGRVLAAVKHAALLGRAIRGAKIVWVDPKPDNNRYERRILEDMGISVQLAWSTEEAMRLLAVTDGSPDLVLSDVMRSEKQATSLSACPAVYYDFPTEQRRAEYNNDIWKFNAFNQTAPAAGFAMAELMAQAHPGLFGDRQRPGIIFYTSAASAGKAADACARIITDRPDVLLENVVSALAALRSELLPEPAAPPKAAATPQ